MASASSSRRTVPARAPGNRPRSQAAQTLLLASLACMAAAPQPAVLPPPEARPAEPALLNDVRVWSTGDVTRVALETSAEVQFRHDRLVKPDRVFVDLLETRPDGSRGRAYTIEVRDGLIQQIRVGLNQPSTTRVVLDLNGPFDYSISQLANPNRVMLEVRRTTSPPETAPGAPLSARPATPVPDPPRQPPVKAFAPPPQQPVRDTAASNLTEPAPNLAAAANIGRATAHKFPIAEPDPPSPPPAEPKTAAETTAAAAPDRGLAPRPAQTNRGNRSLTRVLGLKLNRVVLDPGHGGHDHGSTGRSGVVEKELVLDVAQRLGALIEERLGADVVYTRTDDTFVGLEERTRIANERRADLFLSIHANSSPYRSVSGVETYYLSFTDSKEELEVAARENASSQRSVHELSELVRKIAMRDKVEESREFAAKVQAASHQLVRQVNGNARNRGVKKAPFVVLIGAEMPSVLTEIGFLSNVREEGLLKRGDHRDKIAEALYKGIYQYAQTLSHFRVASSSSPESSR